MREKMPSSNEFMQFYQHSMHEDAIAYDGILDVMDATISHVVCDGIYSPNNSCSSTHQLCPSKDCALKPIRRRSRASKKTPITLLNANTNNFRALVQQFTGCPSTALSFGGHKGPVNLNFEQGVEQKHQHANSSAMPNSAYNYYNQESQMPFQDQEKHVQFLQGQSHQFQEVYHGQQSAYYSCDSAVLSTSSAHRSCVEYPDNDFAIENIDLCELIEDTFLYDNSG